MGHEQRGDDAYVTLLTSDSYLPGVMVLAHSLRDSGTRKKLACMVVMDVLAGSTVSELRTVFDHVLPVDRINNDRPANLYLMDRPDLSSAFTKINLWKLIQYRRIVYVDADVVALRAPDELFDLAASFSAAPDIGWPDCFNSGVMALTPNMGDYYALKALADRGVSFDGADQGLLNMHFRNYNRLSFTYNCTPSGNYQYVPAYKHFQSTISMVHFIGRDKPWTIGKAQSKGTTGGPYQELLGRWWAEYDRHFRAPTSTATTDNSSSLAIQQYVVGEQHLAPSHSSVTAPSIRVHEPSPNQEAIDAAHAPPLPPLEEPINETSKTTSTAVMNRTAEAPPPVFEAPHAEWDASRHAPPPDARPEAANFPSHTYTMSADKDLWQPPRSYPEPPKNMWYEVPKTRTLEPKPTPLFPWEKNQPPPTRIFAEESAPPPPPEPAPTSAAADSSPPLSGGDEFSVSPPSSSPSTGPSASLGSAEGTFSPSSVSFAEYKGANAWDDDAGIGRYVSALLQSRRKGPMQVLIPTSNAEDGAGLVQRRGSMKITEFPDEVERPSLPVTPAPVRGSVVWGSDRDAGGRLPDAEGVPVQMDWNPNQQLEQLRRNSLLFSNTSPSLAAEVPKRHLPESSVEVGLQSNTAVSSEKTRAIITEDVSNRAEIGNSEAVSSEEISEKTETEKLETIVTEDVSEKTETEVVSSQATSWTSTGVVPVFTTPKYGPKSASMFG